MEDEEDKPFYEESDEEDEQEDKPTKYFMDHDHKLLLKATKSLLQSRNSAVRKIWFILTCGFELFLKIQTKVFDKPVLVKYQIKYESTFLACVSCAWISNYINIIILITPGCDGSFAAVLPRGPQKWLSSLCEGAYKAVERQKGSPVHCAAKHRFHFTY